MARKLRIQFEGAIYHAMLRGVDRRRLFTEDRERERFLKRLADGVDNHDIRLYLFCLMPNHVHLVLETPRGNLDRFMHGLETAYSVYFNLRHDRVGHLLQGRYRADLVEGEEYLLRLTRYVHLNPVCSGRAKELPLKERRRLLRRYHWSSYRGYIGEAKPFDFVDYGPVLAQTGAAKESRSSAYRKYVEAGLAATDEELVALMKDPQWGIGREEFRAWVKGRYTELVQGHQTPEDVAFRRIGRTLDAEHIKEVVCEELAIEGRDLLCQRKGSLARPITAKMLCKHGGLTQRAAASALGLTTGAAVSLQLKRLRHAVERQRELRRLVQRIDRRLTRRRATDI